jgi:SAM-dependent methyltransferase
MFAQTAEFYDAIYGFKDYARESAQIALLLRAADPGIRRVLDAACGTGEHARLLAGQHGFEVDGLDLDPALLRIARGKHPAGRFFEADMSAFALERPHRFDAVLCLFSSIAYLVSLARVRQAFACFRAHLRPRGVLLVEPWFPPGVLDVGRVARHTGTHLGVRVERISRVEEVGRISRLYFDYRIESSAGVEERAEIHELGLFTVDEMRAALEESGFSAELDPVGPMGRGLWIARART